MTHIVDYQLRIVDWEACSTLTPGGGGRVPAAVRALAAADSAAAADAAYWLLDNNVVVQGQLFGAALPLVPVLLAALGGELASPARMRVLDLLVEITCGASDESEVRAGNAELGQACRTAARAGLWLYYALLATADAPIRERLVHLIDAVDDDRTRVSELLAYLAQQELSRDLGLPDEPQDWGIVNADARRVDEFATFLTSRELSPAQVFVMIELILASANERLLEDPTADLRRVDDALLEDPAAAATHYDYWGSLEDQVLYPIAEWLRRRPRPQR